MNQINIHKKEKINAILQGVKQKIRNRHNHQMFQDYNIHNENDDYITHNLTNEVKVNRTKINKHNIIKK